MIHSPVFQGFQGERPKKVLATSLTLGGNWTVSGNPKLPNIQTGRECVSFAQVLRPVPKNTVNPVFARNQVCPSRYHANIHDFPTLLMASTDLRRSTVTEPLRQALNPRNTGEYWRVPHDEQDPDHG
jgi:hypothetical protein